jgi:hypothetical protein
MLLDNKHKRKGQDVLSKKNGNVTLAISFFKAFISNGRERKPNETSWILLLCFSFFYLCSLLFLVAIVYRMCVW